MPTLDSIIADLSARYADDPSTRDAAIAGAVDNWLHHETIRTPKESP